MVDFTVAIPTYNGASRLPDVLERLRSQVDIDHFSCEILVIDNNSTDATAALIKSYQKNFPYPIRYLFESRQGAGHARQRAIREAHSELVGFLDDDNLPTPRWVAAAYAFAQQHPHAGAYGSQIHGSFEVEPPPNFQRIQPFLAITERGEVPLQYEAHKKLLPPSAGLVVRRQVWLAHVPSQMILGGRTSDAMLTGEDLEALCYIQQAGWQIWYNPAMEIVHKIPAWRMERSYLMALFLGIGLSRFVTRMVPLLPAQRPWMALAYIANDVRKIVLHLFQYRMQVKTDLAAACEMQLLLGSLISPFYLFNKGYLPRKSAPASSPTRVKSIYSTNPMK